MSTPRRSFGLSLAGMLALLAGVAHADRAISVGSILEARVGYERAIFEIANPAAEISKAIRLNDDRADKQGVIPAPTPGFVFTSTVVILANDADLLAQRVGEAAPLAGAPGFVLVETASVADAIALADTLSAEPFIEHAYVDIERPVTPRSLPTDPLFASQWHLRNTSLPAADANVEAAWALGYTGAGVLVGVIDGGNWQSTHPDMAGKYNTAASIPAGGLSSHAHAVAGVIGASAFNAEGGVGAAYNSTMGSMAYGNGTVNATAFAHRNDITDIKNNSWGPFDNGNYHFMTPAEYAALETAATTGRGGLGTLFAWAAGNGGTGDRVEYDPYAASRYTVAVGAISNLDSASSYNELGSSMLVVAHSSGGSLGITTTDLTGSAGYSSGNYTSNFGGTSSASPLGAGVMALILEANPTLTRRDMHRILAESARKVDPSDPTWTTNAAGFDISYSYGFGAIDAGAAVVLAETWTNLPQEVSVASPTLAVNQAIPDNNTAGVTRTITIDQDISVEEVELFVTINTTYRGDLNIILTSPEGTESILARTGPDSADNLADYRLTTLRHLDESSLGDWTINVSDRAGSDLATWISARLVIFGTESDIVCPADLSSPANPGTPDGVLSGADFFEFLSRFVAGDLSVDFASPTDPTTPDGTLSGADFLRYLDLFQQGC